MKKSSFAISIPTPCHESWDAMTPAEQGRFCQNCQKVVVDFTQMNDEQILKFYKKNPGKGCGRYCASQLNRSLEITQPEKKRFFPAIVFVSITTFLFPSTNASAETRHELVQLPEDARYPVTAFEKVHAPGNDSTYLIKGIVSDKYNTPLPGATIMLQGTRSGTQTNSDGSFKLNVKYTNDEMCIRASLLGFDPIEYTINKYSNNSEIRITLKEFQQTLTGDIIIVARPTFYGRIRSKLRRLFSH